jgi:hypothetical protein
MKKVLGLLLGVCLLVPLPSLADDLEVYQDYHQSDAALYVSNDSSLIQITLDGSDVQGSVWSASDHEWSDAATIFTDAGEEFSIDESDFLAIKELANGAIILSQGDDLISYSDTHGFQHFAQDTDVYDVVVHRNKVTLVNYCVSGEHTAALWSETDGVGTTTTLDGSTCTRDLSYLVGAKAVLVDYYAGVAYRVNDNYEVIDSIDLSDLGYVDSNDDFDPQGNWPRMVTKKSGDLVFVFENHLYGYSYHDQVWQDVVTLPTGYVVNGDDMAEYDYRLIQTEDRKHIYAFAENADQTEYMMYRWSSDSGWAIDATYSFTESTEVITTNIDKQQKKIHWGFWSPTDSSELVIYERDNSGHSELASKTLDCNNCNVTLDVSKKGKLFVVAHGGTGVTNTTLNVWRPSTGHWQTKTLPDNLSGNYITTHVTAKGQWMVIYQKNNSNYGVVRWTPDSGWGNLINLNATATYYNGDTLYDATLDTDGTLSLNRYHWQTGSSSVITTIPSVESFYDDDSFIYDDYWFANYDQTLEAVEL